MANLDRSPVFNSTRNDGVVALLARQFRLAQFSGGANADSATAKFVFPTGMPPGWQECIRIDIEAFVAGNLGGLQKLLEPAEDGG